MTGTGEVACVSCALRLRMAASMPALTSAWANSAVTRMPFRTALASDEPWPMMQAPRTPSSGAPPYSV